MSTSAPDSLIRPTSSSSDALAIAVADADNLQSLDLDRESAGSECGYSRVPAVQVNAPALGCAEPQQLKREVAAVEIVGNAPPCMRAASWSPIPSLRTKSADVSSLW